MNINLLTESLHSLDVWLSAKGLRHYQKKAVYAVIEALSQDHTILLIKMPTGTGQMSVLVTILQYLFEKNAIKKALFLSTHRVVAEQAIDLLDDASYHCGKNMLQGMDSQITFTTYYDLLEYGELLSRYDFAICMDISYTNHHQIMELFEREKKHLCFLGMGKGYNQEEQGFFRKLFPIYKMRDMMQFSEQDFVNDFLHILFIHLGYLNIQSEIELCGGDKRLMLDMLVFKDDGTPMFLIEAKTYRSQFISLSNLNSVVQQISFYKSYITVENYIAIMLCEINREVKLEIYKKFGVQLWDIANLLYLCNNDFFLIKLLSAQVPFPILAIEPEPIIDEKLNQAFLAVPLLSSEEETTQQKAEKLSNRLELCPVGKSGKSNKASKDYEKICVEILLFLFEQEFSQFSTQHKTSDDIFRMDLLCGLKGTTEFWMFLTKFYNTKFVVFEFKNYETRLSQNLIYITEKYLFHAALRNVAILISRKGFHKNALDAAMGCLKENGKLILDITDEDLFYMLEMKADGKEPSDYLLEKVENLLMSVSK